MPEEDRRVRGRAIIRSVVHARAQSLGEAGDALWPLALELRYADAVENAIFGYGRLQPLFEIADAENIEIHGCDTVTVQYGDGHRESHPAVADTDEELVDAIRFLGETATPPRPFDDLHPTMTLALGNRFRLHAIGFGLSFRPSVVIRQHLLTDVTLDELADDAMLPPHVARLLQAAVLARKSIVISGDQGAGKTTLLRALIAAIHPHERFGTLETDYELLTHLLGHRRNILALQARVGMGEMAGGTAAWGPTPWRTSSRRRCGRTSPASSSARSAAPRPGRCSRRCSPARDAWPPRTRTRRRRRSTAWPPAWRRGGC